MSSLTTWVSDRLHDMVGISDKSIAEFLIGLCKKSENPSAFVEKIKDTEAIDIDEKVVLFASELWNKLPKEVTAGEKRRIENRKREEEARDMQSKNKKYALVESDEDESLEIKPKKKKKKKRKEKAESDDSDIDEFERMEKERQEDLKERDEFAQRMIKKDKEKQRNIMTKSDKKAYEEAAKRLAQEAEDREKMLPDLRKESRRQYLAKRKDDKIIELEADIIDEKFLFGDGQLTEREKKEMQYKEKILELAKQHDKASEIEKVQRYHMPDDRNKGNADNDTYVEADEKERVPNYEQKKWEEEHLQSSTWRFGAKDAKERHDKVEKKI